MSNTFLQAEWRKLAMANYAVAPELLQPYLPYRTEIDTWNGTCYVSLVGFMFLNTRVKGIAVPFHRHFEEVNLRFYVRYRDGGNWKRGVVFLKEIVPRPALTLVANLVYGEHYETLPMAHSWERDRDFLRVSYRWKKGRWHEFRVRAEKEAQVIGPGSEEEFITEHFWGYTLQSPTKTSEYEVVHPRWLVYPVKDFAVEVDFGLGYGEAFQFLNTARPLSVFLAEGSGIEVKAGRLV